MLGGFMSDGLFHIDGENRLVSMTVTPYEAEEILQELLETHADLLAGGQMEPDSPRRWLLVKREQGVPDRADAGSRWSVDHLFVDQDAVPTLVEVKRSTDTRIRREVVGQMLDYAANGVRYWPAGELRRAYEDTQSHFEKDPEAEVQTLCVDPDLTLDTFFERVANNLRAGRIRMVFVADVIPDELMRITEFLNEQMSPAQVFAVEVKQYRAEGHDGLVIVPAVYGRTSAASKKNSLGSTSRSENVEGSLPATKDLMERLTDLSDELGLKVHETRSANLLKRDDGRTVACLYLANWNTIDIPLQPLRDRGFSQEVDDALVRLQRTTSKSLSLKSPSVPTDDALTHWDDVRELIADLSRLNEH